MKRLIAIKLIIFTLFFGLSVEASIVDSDNDGLSDSDEVTIYATNPYISDTDEDGYNDKLEIDNGYSPINSSPIKLSSLDTDSDGLWDDWEIALGTDVNNPDTDGDGYKDGLEVANNYDPRETFTKKLEKQVSIDISTQTLTYSFGDIVLDEFKISSGLPGTDTPKGTYNVIKKRPTVQYGGPGFDFHYPNTKWNLMFKYGSWGNYYIHGAYWHDNFGQKMSHGCVNVPYNYEKMGRLYDWADVGTKISID